VGAQAVYRSKTNSSIGDEPIMDIPSYWTLDLQAGAHFKDGRYSLMVWGKNVTDKFYLTNRYFSSTASRSTPGCRRPTASRSQHVFEMKG